LQEGGLIAFQAWAGFRHNEGVIMNSSTSPGSTHAPGTPRPENEDDDPVGDNKPVTESTELDPPPVDQDDEDDLEDASNAGAVRTGNDGEKPPQQSSDADDVPNELPEGSDVPPTDRLNGHRQDGVASGRSGRQPSSDSKLPQSSRG